MNFERNKDPKEALGIGLEPDSVSVEKVFGKISLTWSTKKYTRSAEFKIKKRWFISIKFLLKLLDKKEIKSLHLFLLSRAKLLSNSEETMITMFLPWVFILMKAKENRNKRPKAIINLASNWHVDHEFNNVDRCTISLSIVSPDLEKIQAIQERYGEEAYIKGAIYKGKIYKIKHGNKKLI